MGVVIAILAYLLFFYKITNLVPGFSGREANAYAAGHSLQTIVDHPMNAPYKLVVYALQKLGHHDLLITRVAAAGFSVLACILFFILSRSWFGFRVAFLGTILFATSGGFLHVARLGSSIILQMSLLLLVICKLWWDRSKRTTIADFFLIGVLSALWYVPGMIWFEILAAALLYSKVIKTIQNNSWPKIAGAVCLFLVIIAPLVRACILEPSTLLTFAGLPQHFYSQLTTLHALRDSLLSVAVYSNGPADLWLGHLPLLNVIEVTLAALGIFTFIKRMPPKRTIFIFSATLLSIILIGLAGPVTISSLLPLLYLLIAGGVYELLTQWFTVFPRNPFARFTGVFFVLLLIFFSGLHQFRSYFVAWPHTPATRRVFTIQHQ